MEAISRAELYTSGEIRVHVEKICEGDSVQRAKEIFEKIGMQKTRLRNGILFYLAEESRKFAVIGDSGIHAQVGSDFWNEIRDCLSKKFSEGKFTDGLTDGIEMAGKALGKWFPHEGKNDQNELNNDVSFGPH